MNIPRPPAILFRYFPVRPFIEDIVSGVSLRFANPQDFNDPFEARPALYMDPKDPATYKYHHRVAKKFGMSASERIAKVKALEFRLKRSAGRDLPSDVMQQHMGTIGVLSLTPHPDNLLMWSHYGDSHRGVCIGFDTTIHFFRTAMAVRYRDAYPVINPAIETNDGGLEKTILTKATCWAYEDEWRVVKHTWGEQDRLARMDEYSRRGFDTEKIDILANHNGPGDYAFNKAAVREIIIGARAPADTRVHITGWIRRYNASVRLFQTACHDHQYRLVLRQLD